MHICFLNFCIERYSPTSGGAISTIVAQQARQLIERGHRVSVLSPVNGEPTYDVGELHPVRTGTRETLTFLQRRLSEVNRKINRWDWHFYEVYLASAMRRLRELDPKPDAVLIENDWHAAHHVRRVLPEARLIVHLHNELLTNQSPEQFARSIAATNRFLCVSHSVRRWTLDQHPIPEDKTLVINNAVDATAFSPRPGYDRPARPVRVIFVGRLDPNKGPDLVADAVTTLRDEGHKLDLSIVGSKWYGSSQTSYGFGIGPEAYYQGLNEAVNRIGGRMWGHVDRDRLIDVIRDHDVICVLSRSEDPNPMTCLEGMASGCAIIGSNRGGIPDHLGDVGRLVDPDRPTEIADALRKLVTDPDELVRQKNLSLARAAERTWAWHVDRLEEEVLNACQPA